MILLQKELREWAKGQLAKLRKEIESRSLTELNTTLEATTTSPDKHDQKFNQGDGEQVRNVGVEWKRMENAKMIEDYRQGRQRRSNICLNALLIQEVPHT